MDNNRYIADLEASYELQHGLLHEKILKYRIEPQHRYKMDEKGFLLGITSRSEGSTIELSMKSHQAQQAIQDSSREWIALIACICADGSTVDPSLIYRSDAELYNQAGLKK